MPFDCVVEAKSDGAMESTDAGKQGIEQREKINDQMVEMLNNRLSNLEKLGV